jgi:hypothetical protein
MYLVEVFYSTVIQFVSMACRSGYMQLIIPLTTTPECEEMFCSWLKELAHKLWALVVGGSTALC